MNKKILVCWTLACMDLSMYAGLRAQPAGAEVEWIARTGEAAPNESLSWHALLQLRGASVRRFEVEEELLRAIDLKDGRWTTARAFSHGMKGMYYPKTVESFDVNNVYLWSFDDELRIVKLDQTGASTPVAKVQDDRLGNIMHSQGAGRVSGDPVHGFWVSNNYDGTAVFIEPGTWTVRAVLGVTAVADQSGSRKMFSASVLGAAGSLWVLESGSGALVRRSPQGEELARVPSPFSQVVQAGATAYGVGLHRSEAGVLAVSTTGLEMASVNHAGAIVWRLNVCSSGMPARCVLEAPQRGKPSAMKRAVGDKSGNAWIVDRTDAVFAFGGTGEPRLLAGNTPACGLPSTSTINGALPNRPCVGANERLVRMGEGRYLLYSLTGGLSVTHELQVAPERPARISFKPLSSTLANLPPSLRQEVQHSVSDERVWGFPKPDHSTWPPLRGTVGIPTPYGIVTPSDMMRKYLSSPGGSILTPEDVKLAALFAAPPIFEPGSLSMARLGADLVVIKDRRVAPTQVAAYNARSGTLQQAIPVTGLAQPSGCQQAQTSLEYLFNDDRNKLYLFREWSGEVYVVNPDFSAQLLARLPAGAADPRFGCGAASDGMLVPVAALTPDGSLVIAIGKGVFAQRGKIFERIKAPDGVRQLIVLSDKEALAIAQDGLARLRLAD